MENLENKYLKYYKTNKIKGRKFSWILDGNK